MRTVEELVAKAKSTGASDIHLICGLPPKCRLDGQLENMAEEVLSQEDCVAVAKELAGSRYGELEETGELDLAGTFAGNRCRLHLFKQQKVPSLALLNGWRIWNCCELWHRTWMQLTSDVAVAMA